ncbi:MAG: DUF5615 family PIN-like protein [Leptolyngbyaceae cyanobacterium MAG.088]|nr:DUF5615 family PIN-like protein [Leptolyngbyaceae cyanobacterium MAG.088]
MKFLADMGISPRTVTWLKDQGHDAVRLSDEGLQRLPDADVMAKALAEKRILLTMDLGFGALLAMSRGQFPSTVIFRLSSNDRTVRGAHPTVYPPSRRHCSGGGNKNS